MILISNVFELEGEQASMRCDIEKKENSIQAQTIVQLFLDVCIILSSMGGALWVRMDFQFGGIDTVFLQAKAGGRVPPLKKFDNLRDLRYNSVTTKERADKR